MSNEVDQSQLLIRGGHVVNDDHAFNADVLIENGIIVQVELDIDAPNARVIDARGKLVMPGGIDTQTHVRMPAVTNGTATDDTATDGTVPDGTVPVDDFYHGTRAALAGGTTMIIDCVVPGRGGESLVAAFSRWRATADPRVCCDYALTVGVSQWEESTSHDLAILARDCGVSGFKLLQDRADRALTDTQVYRCAALCRDLGALMLVHPEDPCFIERRAAELIAEGVTGPEGHLLSRPEEVEAWVVYRAVTLANQARAPIYISSILCKSASDVIGRLRDRGAVVVGETTAGGLGASGRHVFNRCWRHAASHVSSPPLRSLPGTPDILMRALATLDLGFRDALQVVCSAHSPHDAPERAQAGGQADFRLIPPGVNGIEDRLAVVWQNGVVLGRMDICRFVAVTSATAAKIFNIYPRKGRVEVGSDADLVVWDPDRPRVVSYRTHQQTCDFNIFEGLLCRGSPALVVCGGRIVLDELGEMRVTAGSGRYVATPCHSEFLYARIHEREKVGMPVGVARDSIDPSAANGSSAPPSPRHAGSRSASPTHSAASTCASTEDLLDCSSSSTGPLLQADHRRKKASTKVNQPPGGKSSPLW